MSLTVMPCPLFTGWSDAGALLPAGKLYTYEAGTTTPLATYSDSAGLVANSNPVILDAAGRATIYLLPQAYRLTLKTSAGVQIWDQDNISAVPGAGSGVDTTGTAGETLAAQQAVYLSDGSGGKTSGKWYKADASEVYSSIKPLVGITIAAITSGSSGTIRLAGEVTGFGGITVGTSYFLSPTPGTLSTSTTFLTRPVAVGVSSSSVSMPAPWPITIGDWANDFRLSLTTAVPVTTTDVTAATTLYCTPYSGVVIDLPDSTGRPIRVATAEFSIAIPATTAQMYDVFAYLASNIPTLELLAWTNDTTRATALSRVTNGVLSKNGDVTRRYLGSVRTTVVSGKTEDSFAKRYVWNYYNRVTRIGRVVEATDNWPYSLAVYQQANASTANQVDFVIGVAEVELTVMVTAMAANVGSVAVAVGIGEDGVTFKTGTLNALTVAGALAGQAVASLRTYPAVGRHYYTWLEWAQASGTTTWYGDNGAAITQSGIHASVMG